MKLQGQIAAGILALVVGLSPVVAPPVSAATPADATVVPAPTWGEPPFEGTVQLKAGESALLTPASNRINGAISISNAPADWNVTVTDANEILIAVPAEAYSGRQIVTYLNGDQPRNIVVDIDAPVLPPFKFKAEAAPGEKVTVDGYEPNPNVKVDLVPGQDLNGWKVEFTAGERIVGQENPEQFPGKEGKGLGGLTGDEFGTVLVTVPVTARPGDFKTIELLVTHLDGKTQTVTIEISVTGTSPLWWLMLIPVGSLAIWGIGNMIGSLVPGSSIPGMTEWTIPRESGKPETPNTPETPGKPDKPGESETPETADAPDSPEPGTPSSPDAPRQEITSVPSGATKLEAGVAWYV